MYYRNVTCFVYVISIKNSAKCKQLYHSNIFSNFSIDHTFLQSRTLILIIDF